MYFFSVIGVSAVLDSETNPSLLKENKREDPLEFSPLQ